MYRTLLLDQVDLSDGVVQIRIQIKDEYYYKMLSDMSGISMESEYELIHTMKELAADEGKVCEGESMPWTQ